MSNQDPGSRDDPIEQLIKSAGRGPSASPEARARVYSAAHAAWRREVAVRPDGVRPSGGARPARPRRRPLLWLAAAAALGAVALLVRLDQATHPLSGTPLAALALVSGPVYVDGRAAGADSVLTEGDTLRTGAGGRAAVGLPAGMVLRVNEDTVVTFAAPARVDLYRGTVYVDSGRRPSAATVDSPALDVRTPLGTVRHVGTQYEVHFAETETRLRVRVREGQVVFRSDAREIAAIAGEQVVIPDNGAPVRSAIAGHDPAWDWAEGLATVRGGNTQNLGELLRWLSRETGRELRFADGVAEREAQTLLLHGVEGLSPTELLEVMGSTTSLSYSEADGALLVSTGP